MVARKPRWRITFQELCHRVGATPQDLENWAAAGALGPRLAESTEGQWRHVTRDVAERAVLTGLLLEQGMTLDSTALLVGKKREVTRHEHGLDIKIDNVTFRVDDPDALDL